MPENAFEEFVSADCAWMHDALAILDDVFGISDVDVDTDESGELVVTATADPDPVAA